MGEKRELRDGMSADEMFPDDPFEDLGRARVVPSTLGIDDGDGAVDADLEAIGLGAGDGAAGAGEAEFAETSLQVFPRFQRTRAVAALRFGGIGAEEDVASDGRQADLGDVSPEFGALGIGGGVRHGGECSGGEGAGGRGSNQ